MMVGHHSFFEPEDTVLHLLRDNLRTNLPAVKLAGGELRLLELDWTAPDKPMEWSLEGAVDGVAAHTTPAAESLATNSPRVGQVEPAELLIGTELVYTEGSAEALLGTVTTWLARTPTAVFYLMQNLHRADWPAFVARLEEFGLEAETVVLDPEDVAAGAEVAAEPERYGMLAIKWRASALA